MPVTQDDRISQLRDVGEAGLPVDKQSCQEIRPTRILSSYYVGTCLYSCKNVEMRHDELKTR
jgi:hypothetical protein